MRTAEQHEHGDESCQTDLNSDTWYDDDAYAKDFLWISKALVVVAFVASVIAIYVTLKGV